jgi:peptide/nickel transport system permease protein
VTGSFIVERLAGLAGILLGISLVTFALANVAPGDPAAILLELQNPGVSPSREAVALYREQLGLDDPAPLRYLRWLGDALRGDLGVSYRTGTPVAEEIAARLPGTLLLAGVSLALAILVGVPLGVLAALRRRSAWDLASRLLALAGAALPSYVLSLLLVLVFAVLLGWLPAFGSGTPQHLVLPALALALGVVTQIMRLTRASVLEVLGQDYVRTARAKGLREASVVRGHVLRNALLPVATAVGVSAGNLLSGAVIVETIFSWHGVGKYAVDAIFLRDYPVVQGVVLYLAVMFVLVNALVDISYRWIDPKLRGTGV